MGRPLLSYIPAAKKMQRRCLAVPKGMLAKDRLRIIREHDLAPPAPAQRLPAHQQKCGVCGEATPTYTRLALQCGHVFHRKCLNDHWNIFPRRLCQLCSQPARSTKSSCGHISAHLHELPALCMSVLPEVPCDECFHADENIMKGPLGLFRSFLEIEAGKEFYDDLARNHKERVATWIDMVNFWEYREQQLFDNLPRTYLEHSESSGSLNPDHRIDAIIAYALDHRGHMYVERSLASGEWRDHDWVASMGPVAREQFLVGSNLQESFARARYLLAEFEKTGVSESQESFETTARADFNTLCDGFREICMLHRILN